MYLWLSEVFGKRRVNGKAPIDVHPSDKPWNEPEPELIVLKQDYETYKSNPLPQDVQVVVEISDSTLNFDLTAKAKLYARAGIIEYWVLDVNQHRLFVHRFPSAEGFTDIQVYGPHESIAPLSAPNALFAPIQIA